MAIPQFVKDIAYISKLGENPNTDNDLTSDELKALFDQAALDLKEFLNTTLIPSINTIIDVEALLQAAIDKTLTKENMSAEAKATGEALKKKLDIAGGILTGALSVLTPTEDSHPATKKYVDDKHFTRSAALPAAGWEGESAPYTQTVAVESITAEDNPIYGVAYSGDNDAMIAQQDAFALVDDLSTADGSVTFTCFRHKPAVDLTIRMEVNR